MTDHTAPSVAVIGVGVMGSAIATRLLETGRASPSSIPTRRSCGRSSTAARAPRLGRRRRARSALCHPEPQCGADRRGRCVRAGRRRRRRRLRKRSSSTCRRSIRESTRALAARFHAETGGRWLDCPLSGGAPGALVGRLTVMAGGDESDFERARTVMGRLAANYTLMGPIGAGQATKLVNQVLCAIQFQAVAEAIALAERAGVAAERIPAALAGGRADSRILQEFGAEDGAARLFADRTARQHGEGPRRRSGAGPRDDDAIAGDRDRRRDPSLRSSPAGLGAEDNAAMMRQFDGPRETPPRR